MITLDLNKIKNIGGHKILVPTKHWRQQNIGADKIHVSTELLALTKYWRQQNTGVNKILASTKCWRGQNTGVDKIRASTKSWRWQNLGVDKKLAQTKCWPDTKIETWHRPIVSIDTIGRSNRYQKIDQSDLSPTSAFKYLHLLKFEIILLVALTELSIALSFAQLA
jgi:hypothetical protein